MGSRKDARKEMAKELKKSGMGPNDKDLCDLAEDIDKYEKGQAAKLLVQLLKGKKDKKGKKAKKGKKGGKGKGKGGDEGMEGPEGPEDMPPMGPPPSCAERAFEGLWMATTTSTLPNSAPLSTTAAWRTPTAHPRTPRWPRDGSTKSPEASPSPKTK